MRKGINSWASKSRRHVPGAFKYFWVCTSVTSNIYGGIISRQICMKWASPHIGTQFRVVLHQRPKQVCSGYGIKRLKVGRLVEASRICPIPIVCPIAGLYRCFRQVVKKSGGLVKFCRVTCRERTKKIISSREIVKNVPVHPFPVLIVISVL